MLDQLNENSNKTCLGWNGGIKRGFDNSEN